ncbi:MAG: hypothetical protein Kow0042_25630 [Calditrichia bacterium]
MDEKKRLDKSLLLLALASVMFFLIILITNIGFVSAQTCVVTQSNNCQARYQHVVMRLSGTTNAHGALASQSNFPYVLCCDFGNGDTFCNGNNKILGMSSAGNAHAEQPDLVSSIYSFANDVCYDSLIDARTTPNNCNILNNETEVLFISTTPNNAHIEGVLGTQNYNNKICAQIKFIQPPTPTNQCQFTNAYFERGGAPITNGTGGNNVVERETTVSLVVEGNSYCDGENIEFVLVEDTIGHPGSSLGQGVFSAGRATIDRSIPLMYGLNYAFYHFDAVQVNNASNNANSYYDFGNPMLEVYDPNNPVVITYCMDYTQENQCMQDPEGVNVTTVESTH